MTPGERIAQRLLDGPCRDAKTGEWYWSILGYTNGDDKGTKEAAVARHAEVRDAMRDEIDSSIRRAVLAERKACRRQLPMHWGPNYTKGAFKIFDQAAKARDARRKKR